MCTRKTGAKPCSGEVITALCQLARDGEHVTPQKENVRGQSEGVLISNEYNGKQALMPTPGAYENQYGPTPAGRFWCSFDLMLACFLIES